MKTPRCSLIVPFLAFVAALAASSVCFAQPTPAAQVPPPVGVTPVAPLAMCPGMTQGQTCDNLAWVAQRRTEELARQPTQPETAEARRARQAQCVQTYCGGQTGDTVCTCMCRDSYLSAAAGVCVPLGDAVDALVVLAGNHETRIAALEARAGITGGHVLSADVPRRSHVRRARRRH